MSPRGDIWAREIQQGLRKTKPCPGPFHLGKELPLENFARRRSDDPNHLRSWCRECEGALRTKGGFQRRHGLVPLSRVKFVFIELVERIGRNETHRRLGISNTALWMIRGNRQKYVQKHTASLAINLLRNLREDNVVRSRRDIKRGASARGEAEKGVNDVYRDTKRTISMTKGERELDRRLKELENAQ